MNTPDISDQYPDLPFLLNFKSFGGINNFSGEVVTLKCDDDNSLVRSILSEPGQSRVLLVDGNASAVAAGNIFHYIEHSTIIAKMNLLQSNIDIRMDSEATYEGRQFDNNGRLMMMSEENLSKVEFTRGKKDII